MRTRPEILAPAGDRAAMEAAVRGGADAVYFGLSTFNARARATNFDPAILGETMAYLHANGVKGYVTLNTLVFDDELARLEEVVRACADAAVDAVIVQDLGVAALVHAIAPSLPLHASTQMTCTDAASVELARSVGASRVILARELALEDIAAIRAQTDAELEVFVHGALCIAYSGQCLTSEAIGGRSANRGACAQACRLPYELLVDGVLHDLGEHAYLLSPEDLEASALVPDLIDLGITSLKIEGRLKGPAYVAATARLYKTAVDAAMGEGDAPSETLRETALSTFTRGSGPGFFRGVDHQRLVDGRTCDHRGLVAGEARGTRMAQGKPHLWFRASREIARGDGLLVEGGFATEGEIGGRVWSLATMDGVEVEHAEAGRDVLAWLGPERPLGAVTNGRRVFLTSDPRAQKAALEMAPLRTPLDVRLIGAVGATPRLEGKTGRGGFASVDLDALLLPADRSPLDATLLREKIDRFGDTPFVLRDVAIEVDAPARVAPSALNRGRRALVDALAAGSHHLRATTTASARALLDAALPPDRAPAEPGLFVLCRNLEQAEAALAAKADGVILDFLELVGTGEAARSLLATGAKVTLTPPRIRKPGEEKIDRFLRAQHPSALLVRSLGALHELAADDATPAIGDFSLNVTNRLTASEVLRRGLSAFTPSFDLDEAQLLALVRSPVGPWAEIVVHHPMALFHMEHCVIAHALSDGRDHKTCGRPCETHRLALRDRAGMEHPLEADVGCRNTVFHAVPQSAARLVPALVEAGVRRFRIELVREPASDVARLVASYRALISGTKAPAAVLRDLRSEGGYGVVRGSLRVLQ